MKIFVLIDFGFFIQIPLYAIYKAGKLYFFSPYAQLGAGGNADEDESADGKKGKRKVVRVARH